MYHCRTGSAANPTAATEFGENKSDWCNSFRALYSPRCKYLQMNSPNMFLVVLTEYSGSCSEIHLYKFGLEIDYQIWSIWPRV